MICLEVYVQVIERADLKNSTVTKNLNASNSDLLSSTKMAHRQVSFDILFLCFLLLTVSANEVTKELTCLRGDIYPG